MRFSVVMFVPMITFCTTSLRDDPVIRSVVHKHTIFACYLILQDHLFDLYVQ
jgi:hypothetical protein